jgi:hypothetical protein
LAELAAKYRSKDKALESMLASYDASIREPNNQLVHLYEIRDALSSRFGGERPAKTALQINATAWSDFGKLAKLPPSTARDAFVRGATLNGGSAR